MLLILRWEGFMIALEITREIGNLPKLKEHLITFETRIIEDGVIVVMDKVWDREPKGSKLIFKTC
jgi:hypothetical protein